MPGEAYDAHVVAEVLPAELRPDPEGLGQPEDLLLELEVPEPVGGHGPGGRQVVEQYVACRRRRIATASARRAEAALPSIAVVRPLP